MRTKIVFSLVTCLGLIISGAAPAHALSLRVQPLTYTVELQSGEVKKGFIDVTNTSGTTLMLRTSVQAFRQTDDQGHLQFYDNAQVKAGLIPDLKKFQLKSNQTERLYFLLRGDRLPSGDVFAALFVTSQAGRQGNVGQALRMGTLFSIVNGTPGPRKAVVTKLHVPFWQFGETIHGSYTVKNTANPTKATGFYPQVTLALDPLHVQQVETASLVFAGRERTNTFQLPSGRLGIYRVNVSVDGSQKQQWVIAVTGYWQWLAPLLGLAIAVLLLWIGGKHIAGRRSRRHYGRRR